MSPRRSLRQRQLLIPDSSPVRSKSAQAGPDRPISQSPSAVTVRGDPVAEKGRKPLLYLKITMPPSKLRQAQSATQTGPSLTAREGLEGGAIVSGPRANRTKVKYTVVESESDQDEDEEDEEEQEDEDEEEEDEDDGVADEELLGEEEAEDEEDEDAEGDEDGDADGDTDMQGATPIPPPTILKAPGSKSKPTMVITPAADSKLRSVEAQEMELEEDDEELSDLGSDAERDDDEDGTPATGSRGSTPDITKMTKRQRGRLDQVMGGDFLQLPMEPQIKKHLTAEEHAMRRAEMARRRKNLSEKRNEEEKMDTINRLLKKQAPKRRGKISQAELQEGTDREEIEEETEPEKANPVYTRWVSNAGGCRLGVPREWLDGPAGTVFGGLSSGKMVEEIE